MNNWNIDRLSSIASLFDSSVWGRISEEASANNELFTPANISYAAQSIKEKMLAPAKLLEWLTRYTPPKGPSRRVGIIMAGNIPMVGFFDLLAVLASGHSASVKPSSKDSILMGYIVDYLSSMGFDVELCSQIDRYDIDALIATGSDATIHSIGQNFGGIPTLFRGSRRSVAIINQVSDINNSLLDEITKYWGLGCRSVSHLLLSHTHAQAPEVANRLKMLLENYQIEQCSIFDDSYRHSKALNTMISRGCDCSRLMLLPSTIQDIVGIGEVGYSYFNSQQELDEILALNSNKLQFISLSPYGQSQQPELWDYADGIDTMDFLLKLYK